MFVRNGDIDPQKASGREGPQRFRYCANWDLNADILGIDSAGPEGRIMHLRRFGMGDRITDNRQPGRGRQLGRDGIPMVLQVLKRVEIGHNRSQTRAANLPEAALSGKLEIVEVGNRPVCQRGAS